MEKKTSDEIYQRAQRDMRYFGDHEQELWEQYGEQWVAIYNEEVVSIHSDLDILMAELEERAFLQAWLPKACLLQKAIILNKSAPAPETPEPEKCFLAIG